MRVLHLTPSVGRRSGGIGPVVLELARVQRDIGHEPTIWHLDRAVDAREAVESSGLARCAHAWPRLGPNALGFSLDLARAVLAPETRVDVVHQHGIWLALSALTALCRGRRRWDTVVAPQGSLDRKALQRSAWRKRIATWAYEGRNLGSASCLQALSEAEAASFRAFGLRAPIAVIPNGVSGDWLASAGSRESLAREHGLPADRRILLFLSRIHPKKGLPMLLDALRALGERFTGEWILVVAGPDELGHRAEVERRARGLGLDRSVRFVGPVYGQAKRDAFAAAELFVLPSHSEGAPIAILEALGAGVPVVTTHASPWRELVTEDCGWWVATSAEGLASGLAEALSRPAPALAKMGERGRRLIAARYTWRAVAAQTLDVYSDLLAAPRALPSASRAVLSAR